MKHTYLLRPGIWMAEGTFTDNTGTRFPVSGISTITHEPGIWYNRAAMIIHTQPIADVECVYEISPLAPGQMATTWVAETLPMGRMSGNFAIIDNTILSSAQTPQGNNLETLRYIDDDTYENRGALFFEGQMLSTWEVTLTRKP